MVRDKIMDLYINHPGDSFDQGVNAALKQAADIAEAREKELLAEKAALIAELRGLVGYR